jgi:hypothetical protein
MAPVTPPLPSIDRPAVSRPAALLAGPLARTCDLSEYRLAGGTALAWYLGHRRSDDLDFFTRTAGLLDGAEQDHIASALSALDADAEVDISQPRTLHAVVRGCKVSIFELPGQWLSEPVRVAEGIGLATVDEIASMKLVAVSTRSSKKDFFDLHALVTRGYGAERMFSGLRGMYPGEVDLGVGHHVARALTDFSDAEVEPDPIVLDGATWKEAKRSASRLSTDLAAHLAALARSGSMG